MANVVFLLKGLIVGFVIAAPVGPIGVLCVRRTLVHGRTADLLSGLGAATADALYGCVVALGLTVVSDVLVAHDALLRLVGGAILCLLGVNRVSGVLIALFGLALLVPAVLQAP